MTKCKASNMEEVILYEYHDQILKNQKGLEIMKPLTLGSLRIHHGENTGIQVRANQEIRQGHRPKNPNDLHSHLNLHKNFAHQTQMWYW